MHKCYALANIHQREKRPRHAATARYRPNKRMNRKELSDDCTQNSTTGRKAEIATYNLGVNAATMLNGVQLQQYSTDVKLWPNPQVAITEISSEETLSILRATLSNTSAHMHADSLAHIQTCTHARMRQSIRRRRRSQRQF